jgi:cytochrome b6-f complex iron-sulfur subunit
MDDQLPPKQAWEVDFPIESVEAQHVSRREFAKFLCLVSAGLCVGNAWFAVKDQLFPKEDLKGLFFVCDASEIPVAGMKSFIIPQTHVPYILIRLGENEWRAFEEKCTHLSCAVYYRSDLGKIECPCHNGYFDARTGQVLQGPPPRPLPQLGVFTDGSKIFVGSLQQQEKQT